MIDLTLGVKAHRILTTNFLLMGSLASNTANCTIISLCGKDNTAISTSVEHMYTYVCTCTCMPIQVVPQVGKCPWALSNTTRCSSLVWMSTFLEKSQLQTFYMKVANRFDFLGWYVHGHLLSLEWALKLPVHSYYHFNYKYTLVEQFHTCIQCKASWIAYTPGTGGWGLGGRG